MLARISDRPDSAFSGHKLECVLEGYSDVADLLRRHNEQNRGIYFVINRGGHTDEEISTITAQSMEIDDLPLEEQLPKIQSFPLEPSIIVKTRKSLHCYWLMRSAKKEKFRRIQKQLIAHFGADSACINESRVFRLPGFYHCKEEPVMVECIKFNPELRYTQEQLEDVLPDIPDEPVAVTPSDTPMRDCGNQRGLAVCGWQCAYLQYCKKNAATLSEPLWYGMITNYAVFKGGVDKIHKLSSKYPTYTYEETQRKIEHFYKSNTKPMTCQKIAEHGYKCPKMDTCKCKSPAGLAFIPLPLADIKKFLSKIKKSNDPVTDMEMAQEFVSDYLYNQKPTVSETFIKYNIKQYFGFKADDCRPLIVAYRDMYAEFTQLNHAKKSEEDATTPSWYRQNMKGDWRFMPGILAKHLAENFHAFYCTEQYYFYNNGVYSPKNDKDAKSQVQTYLMPSESLMNHINDAEGQWQLQIRTPINQINPNSLVINCTNGLYNVLDDSFKPHDPKYLSTVQIKAKHDPEAKCPQWMKFLHSSLDEPEINLLQEIFGYFLVPITKAQKSFVLCGMSDVGKSKILTTLQEVLLGAENVSNVPCKSFQNGSNPHSFLESWRIFMPTFQISPHELRT